MPLWFVTDVDRSGRRVVVKSQGKKARRPQVMVGRESDGLPWYNTAWAVGMAILELGKGFGKPREGEIEEIEESCFRRTGSD